MKTETNTTFWYALISCNLRFDLDCQYLPLKYYTCGKHSAYLKNFFLFLSIPSFSLSNWFRTKTIGCHNDCSIIFPSHWAFSLPWLDISATSRYPLFFFRTSFFLEVGTSFKRSALKVPVVGMFLRDHWSINWNELKTLSTENSIGFRLPSESTGKLSTMSNAT